MHHPAAGPRHPGVPGHRHDTEIDQDLHPPGDRRLAQPGGPDHVILSEFFPAPLVEEAEQLRMPQPPAVVALSRDAGPPEVRQYGLDAPGFGPELVRDLFGVVLPSSVREFQQYSVDQGFLSVHGSTAPRHLQ